MNWDYPIHSFTDQNVEPQTPTRNAPLNPFESAYRTPKLESSFHDPRVTWNTADPYASSPELSSVLPSRFDVVSPSPLRGRLPGGHTDGPKGDQGSASRGRTKRSSMMLYEDDSTEVEDGSSRSAASIQTPPPSSTSRRKTQDAAAHSTADIHATPVQASYSNTHLETPSRLIGLAPSFFGLRESPDLFQIAGTDTPGLPRYQMPWEQDTELPSLATAHPHPENHQTGSVAQFNVDLFDDTTGDTGLETPRLPVNRSVGRRRVDSLSRQAHGTHDNAFNTSFSASPRTLAPAPEDPSMFLSSPARRFGFSDPTYSPIASRVEPRQPYHYQTEESERNRREKELKKLQRAKSVGQKQSIPAAETLHNPKTRPSIKRSSTHQGTSTAPHMRNHSQNSFSSGNATISRGAVRKSPSKGRISPVKPLLHSFSRPSTSTRAPMESLILKVGKDGRATTEMKSVGDSLSGFPGIHLVDLEELSTESDNDSDISEFPIARSHAPSFNFPEVTPRKPSVPRTPSTSRPHSKSSSHSSGTTVGSSHSGYKTGWTDSSRGSGGRLEPLSEHEWSHHRQQQQQQQHRRPSVNPFSSHSRKPSATESECTQEEDDDTGDAQHALKEVLKARNRHSNAAGYGSLSRTSRSLAMATLRSSPPVMGYPESQGRNSSSPTTVTDPGFVTPTTERQNNPSTGTRCVCKSNNNGGHLMIQCESCTFWLHTKCVGLERQSLPPIYICIYCTQTPMRGGRIRKPNSRVTHASPLNPKSYGFR
ncbi:hypothetical protein FQN57_000178 [Myotisia sp. PD_48]|nr:hypothetical protein FQN57_000178 [Myotisia sp. PD_48]